MQVYIVLDVAFGFPLQSLNFHCPQNLLRSGPALEMLPSLKLSSARTHAIAMARVAVALRWAHNTRPDQLSGRKKATDSHHDLHVQTHPNLHCDCTQEVNIAIATTVVVSK